MIRSIYARTILLIAFLVCLSLGGLGFYRLYSDRMVSRYLSLQAEEKQRLLKRVVDSVSEKQKVFAYDYSYWDELIKFVYEPTQQWAEENLNESLKTFDIQAIWVYDRDFRIVHRVSPFHTKEGTPYTVEREVLDILRNGHWFNHYFTIVKEGVLEIRTAPIQPSADDMRTSRPHGFLVVGMIWNERVYRNIGEMTESEAAEVLLGGKEKDDGEMKHGPILVRVSVPLPDWNGKPVAFVDSRSESALTAHLLAMQDGVFVFAVVFVISLLGLLSFFLFRNLNIPLKLVALSLSGRDPSPIRPLLKKSTEFGGIAKLMLEFFEQQEKLSEEIRKRTLAEDEIRSALREKEILLHEIHHRVRNNLQLLQSLLALQRSASAEGNVQNALSSVISRVRSLSLVHEGLYHQEIFSRILMSDYIQKLCYELRSQLGKSEKIKLRIDADDIYIDIDTAVPLGLILNELLRNAFLHGFSESEEGRIVIQVVKAGRETTVIVEDDGKGFTDSSQYENPTTLGLTLVQTLTRQLQGEFRVVTTETSTRMILTLNQ